MLGKLSIPKAYKEKCGSCLWQTLRKSVLKKELSWLSLMKRIVLSKRWPLPVIASTRTSTLLSLRICTISMPLRNSRALASRLQKKTWRIWMRASFITMRSSGLMFMKMTSWSVRSRKSCNQVPMMSGLWNAKANETFSCLISHQWCSISISRVIGSMWTS